MDIKDYGLMFYNGSSETYGGKMRDTEQQWKEDFIIVIGLEFLQVSALKLCHRIFRQDYATKSLIKHI